MKIQEPLYYNAFSDIFYELNLSTWNDAAEIFGFSTSTFRRKMQGITEFELNEIKRMIHITGVPFETLFYKEDDATRPQAIILDSKSKKKLYTRTPFIGLTIFLIKNEMSSQQLSIYISQIVPVSARAIQNHLSGKTQPTISVIKAILDITQSSFQDIFL